MKNLFYAAMVVLMIVFGFTAYRQNEKAEIYRDEKNKMHEELIKVRMEAQSARVEVAKLKLMLEAERKNTQELLQKAAKKK